MRTSIAVALALGALLVSTAALAQNRYLNAAMKLYGDLEYESALENLKKAERQSGNSVAEDIQIALYTGLIQFELGHEEAAESAFKNALALDEKAALPRGVSPKAVALFEKARKDIAKRRPPPVAVAKPDDAPRAPKVTVTKVEVPPLVAKPQPTPPPTATVKKESSNTLGLAVGIPLLVIGAGLLGGGAYFGLQSSDLIDEINAQPFQIDAQAKYDANYTRARDAALTANIMYGVGGAAIVAGAVTLIATLVGGGDKPAPAPEPSW